MKHLTVGDLHLYDREMRSTKSMVDNSTVILEKLYEFIKDNEDIVILNINGDIQHKTPVNKFNRQEVAKWRYMFNKIGLLMRSRFKEHIKGYKLIGVSEEVQNDFKKGMIRPIFTTRGNHDIDTELRHTFFDDLLEEGLIVNSTGLLVQVEEKQTFFSYRDYGIKERKMPKLNKKIDVIALEHNDLLHDASIIWKVPNAEKKFKTVEEVADKTDVTILGHMHDKIDPFKVDTESGKSVIWQTGAMARTSFEESNKRDAGYGALMEFGNIEDFISVEFDLIPYKEYFSYKKMMRVNEHENEYKDFDLKMEEKERVSTNYEDDINSFEDVEDEVKEYAKKVIESIKNNE